MSLMLKLIVMNLICFSLATANERHHHDGEHESHQGHEQHGAHVHGLGHLNLVLEGKALQMELLSPAANIVGFEYAPSSASEHMDFEKAIAKLRLAEHLFAFNKSADCKVKQVEIDAGPGKDQTHSDITAFYQFHCHQPASLTDIKVELFHQFPGFETLEVNYVVNSRQGAKTLTHDNNEMSF